MKYCYAFLITLLFYSCGTTVIYDFDEQKDISKYTTYNYYHPLASNLNELDDKRIQKITDSLLLEKGMKKTSSPEILINFFSNEVVTHSNNTIGVGMGGGNFNSAFGIITGIPVGGNLISQELTIDFIDAQLDALVWQAKALGRYKEKANPIQKDKYYKQTLTKVFKKYPPKQN